MYFLTLSKLISLMDLDLSWTSIITEGLLNAELQPFASMTLWEQLPLDLVYFV